MKTERVRISHEEYLKGKYQYVSTGSELTDPHDGSSSVTYHEARVYYNDDGSINEELTYSKRAQKPEKESKNKNKTEEKDKTEKKSDSSETTEKEGCLMKMIKAPFKWLLQALWWLTKKILGILTLGLLSSWLNDDK